jgi:hypothetical protein
MSLDIRTIDNAKIQSCRDHVIILPSNFLDGDAEEPIYASSTISFFKYCENELPLQYWTMPEVLLEQRSDELFAPVILFSSDLIKEHPMIISILLNTLARYVYDTFKGKIKPKINLRVIHTDGDQSTEIHYRGEVENLEQIKDAVLEAVRKG